MALQGEYLGMRLAVDDIDTENLGYFERCGEHNFSLQECTECHLLRYPPTTACPWCTNPESTWTAVEGVGTVCSYGEVHHAIQPAMREHLPYMLLLVELDTQRGQPTGHEALRVLGNLVDEDGNLAPPEDVRRCGIGSRVRIVYNDVGEGFAIPQWTLTSEGGEVWRYAQE